MHITFCLISLFAIISIFIEYGHPVVIIMCSQSTVERNVIISVVVTVSVRQS